MCIRDSLYSLQYYIVSKLYSISGIFGFEIISMKSLFKLSGSDVTVDYKNEILSGLTVALALVPEAIAFALIAGLSPLTGLYAAFSIGLITSILGGRPGMISGATGAVAVVIVALSKSHGVEYIFAAVVLAGIIQFLAGVFKLGKFISCLLYTSPSPRDRTRSRMPSSA